MSLPSNPLPLRTRLKVSFVFLPLTVLYLAAIFLQPWAEPKWMFLDSLAAAEYAPTCCSVYYGFVSNTGILLWVITATTCLFSALLLFATKQNKALMKLALTGGLLTGWIALDDLFLLHERAFPNLGVPQLLVICLYAGLAIAYVLANWRFIWRQDWWLLFLGGGGLAFSIFIDIVFHSLDDLLIYIEDSAKFFGIACWTLFHLLTLYGHLSAHLKQKPTDRTFR
ncbi:MAG: hypothetical protein OIF54_12385 [Cohaesibacter sp.]|nr:hypothetical protein [Cohaesibacter sp.]